MNENIKKILKKGGQDLRLLDFDCDKSHEELLISNTIFSHDFAKKFFGEDWKNYLGEMVLEEDKIKYLSKFLN